MNDDASESLVRDHFERLGNARDRDSLTELMAVNFVEHAAAPFSETSPGPVNGPEAMGATVEWLLGQFPDVRFTIEEMVAQGDLVVARVLCEGSNLGKLNGFLPPSGKHFSSRQTHWFRVREGQLAEHWATRDDLTSMLQLGVVTGPRLGALRRQLVSAARYRFRSRSGSRPKA